MTDFLLCAILVVLVFKDRVSEGETFQHSSNDEVITYVWATLILFLILQFLKWLTQGYL